MFDIGNNSSTLLFLSVGGNDLLEKYRLNGVITSDEMNEIFEKYKLLVKAIREKLPCVKIILTNLYHVNNDKYKDINTTIDQWNTMLSDYVTSNNDATILDLNHLITEPSDLRQTIEPSEIGGKKIANKIKEYL